MKKKLFLALLSAILIFPIVSAHSQQKDKDDDDDDDRPVFRPPSLKPGEKPADFDFSCPYRKGYQHPAKFSGFTVQLLPGTKAPAERCRATIASAKGTVTTAAADWALTVDKISGADVNGDGQADLVIDAYSGGERCCFTYTIVGLGTAPKVIRKIESRSALIFEKQTDGSVLIHGPDSTLDYFLVPHPMAVVPQVFMKMHGDNLENVSSQFQAQYDRLIEEAREQLTSADLEKFRQSRYNDKMFTDQLPTMRRVLTIVVNYLYSGREEQAWKALEELWPASDQGRVKGLILERRGRGLLKQINGANAIAASDGA
ncbi:MAG: hypothetical protein JWQ87_3245 [Candidatus Sulfotelmatobacter sp.]|nr:hypothetical protein [Candidatus Sulfotelmatobacter sp.]